MGVLIQGEGQGLGLGEHGEALRPQLHFAGGQAGVVGLLIPVGDEPLHLHHGLHAQCFRPAEVLRGKRRPSHTTWSTPSRSFTSRKITPPMSRRVCTQPQHTAACPMCSRRSAPQ